METLDVRAESEDSEQSGTYGWRRWSRWTLDVHFCSWSWTLNSLNGRSLKSGSWDSGSGRLGLPSGPSAKKRSSAQVLGTRQLESVECVGGPWIV